MSIWRRGGRATGCYRTASLRRVSRSVQNGLTPGERLSVQNGLTQRPNGVICVRVQNGLTRARGGAWRASSGDVRAAGPQSDRGRTAKKRAVVIPRPYSCSVVEHEERTADKSRSGRERILAAAYDLFSRSGIRAIGVDTITDEAEVAKMTLYRNFNGKNGLALAFLELRRDRWFKGWLQAEIEARAASPTSRLLAIFDIFTEWFERDDFDGCPFVRSLLEFEDPRDPVRQASVEHLADIRAYFCELATDAGAVDPERFAAQWHILVKGAIIAAHEGDRDAAMKARDLGMLLLEREALAEVTSPISR